MNTIGLMWIAAGLISLSNSAADSVAWGEAVSGIRMGIGFKVPSPDIELRILIQNVGSDKREILIGDQIGNDTSVDLLVNLRFTATAADGKKRQGYEKNAFSIFSLSKPAIIQLDPGATHELMFPLNQIICVEKPGNLTFDDLVKQGFSVHVSLETDDASARWARLSSPWIGKMLSGELSPPKKRHNVASP